jgi:site-specific recombinase XerD
LKADSIVSLINESKNLLHTAIIEVLYSTGARCNEIRNMNIEDVNFEDRSITIRGGKGGKDRLVLLSQRAAKILQQYLNEMRPKLLKKASTKKQLTEDSYKAIFVSNRGTRIANRTIQHFISKLSEKAGVKHTTPHVLRHSFASHLVMSKTNIRVVQQLLGHSSLDTTQIYANITPEYLKSEFEDSLPIR